MENFQSIMFLQNCNCSYNFLYVHLKKCLVDTNCSIPATNFLQISPTLLKIQGGGAFGGYK